MIDAPKLDNITLRVLTCSKWSFFKTLIIIRIVENKNEIVLRSDIFVCGVYFNENRLTLNINHLKFKA